MRSVVEVRCGQILRGFFFFFKEQIIRFVMKEQSSMTPKFLA